MAGKKITKAEFDTMTQKYQKKNKDKTRSVIFDRSVIEELLADTKAKKVAIYFAENDEDLNTLALIGVDSDNTVTGDPYNAGGLCPPNCPIIEEEE